MMNFHIRAALMQKLGRMQEGAQSVSFLKGATRTDGQGAFPRLEAEA